MNLGDKLYKLSDPDIEYEIESENDINFKLKLIKSDLPENLHNIARYIIPKAEIEKYCGRL